MALDLGVFLEGAGGGNKVKVTSNDALAQYLKDKITSTDASVTITEVNNGSTETLDLSVSGGSDTNVANTNLTNDANRSVDMNGFKTGFTNGEFGIGTSSPDDSAQLDITSTDKGLLIPRVTTAQMNAISTPATNLLVFNTDLEALYRYDGASWVALSAGYGIIEVITDADSGTPTYYATLSSALDACKTSGSYNVVTLRSNIEVTSSIDITTSGGFLFENLLINLNGFKIYNTQADTDEIIDIDFSTSNVDRKLSIINGQLVRTNQTGSANAVIRALTNTEGGLSMSNVIVYNDGSGRAGFFQFDETSENKADVIVDLGGSKFISQSGEGIKLQGGKFKNFTGISLGAGDGVDTECYLTQNFHAESNSGNGLRTSSGCEIVSHFTAFSSTGYGFYNQNNYPHEVSNFVVRSESNRGIYSVNGGGKLSNFEAYSGVGFALFLSNDHWISNGLIVTNSGTAAAKIDKGVIASNCTFINNSGSYGIQFDNAGAHFTNCTFYAKAGIGAQVTDGHTISNCLFKSDLNTSSGHACEFTGIATTIYVSLCKFEVVNSGANHLYASSAQTVNATNNVYDATATTPVNANVTITSTGSADAYGNIQE